MYVLYSSEILGVPDPVIMIDPGHLDPFTRFAETTFEIACRFPRSYLLLSIPVRVTN
jgi:hypothetical protein